MRAAAKVQYTVQSKPSRAAWKAGKERARRNGWREGRLAVACQRCLERLEVLRRVGLVHAHGAAARFRQRSRARVRLPPANSGPAHCSANRFNRSKGTHSGGREGGRARARKRQKEREKVWEGGKERARERE